MKKIISILLLLSHTSLLFADTLTFKSGQKIEGKLISISEEHELDPNTGTTSEVTFNVDKFSINTIPKEMIVGKINESIFIFDQQSIYKITGDYGNILLIRPFKYGSDGEFIEIPKSDKGEHDELIEGIGNVIEVADEVVNSPQVKGVLILVGCATLFALFLALQEFFGSGGFRI
tara:strand:- start:20 stop:544 length:525 start_codon:yes stop_codon:yes gene_type:complete